MTLRWFAAVTVTTTFVALGSVVPAARAAQCLELTGMSCPVDGFGKILITKKLPTKAGKIVPINGRFCGLGSVTGTAAVDRDRTQLEIGGAFYCDAEQGQFEVFLDPTDLAAGGFGYADYGSYGLTGNCDIAIVPCTVDF